MVLKTGISVLAVVGDATPFEGVIGWIRRRGQAVQIVLNGNDGIRAHHDAGADLVLVGLPLPDLASGALLAELRKQDPRVAIIVVGAGDAAIEDALSLAKNNRVVIVNRGTGFARAKEANVNQIARAIRNGLVECLSEATIARIEPCTPGGAPVYNVAIQIEKPTGRPYALLEV